MYLNIPFRKWIRAQTGNINIHDITCRGTFVECFYMSGSTPSVDGFPISSWRHPWGGRAPLWSPFKKEEAQAADTLEECSQGRTPRKVRARSWVQPPSTTTPCPVHCAEQVSDGVLARSHVGLCDGFIIYLLPVPLASQFLIIVRPFLYNLFGTYLLILEVIEKYEGKSVICASRNNHAYDVDIVSFSCYWEN